MRVLVNGIHLWFDVEGPGLVPDGPEMRARPTVVLLHGGPGSFDHSYFKPDFSRLARVVQVVYLDLRGHGRSDHGDPDAWSFEDALPPGVGRLEIIEGAGHFSWRDEPERVWQVLERFVEETASGPLSASRST